MIVAIYEHQVAKWHHAMFTTSSATHSSQGIATEGVKGVKENQKTELLLKKKALQFKGKQNKLSKNTLFLFLGESNRIMLRTFHKSSS